ncbi:MAG TPA: arginine--tRNA ligase [Rhodocyclaceae bacterium]|nr:arginine--tRNA ligase [Rhodocyclaceae bacterium]HMZ82760.1 arginine--tRNA ligase [Rhodocyclaceae bacterium]HNA02505.1 arginine--tRNA ligase [Rhodocyclaceae bacterium]HNB78894.1 arginine--tRNA ligase [Rhodocyclaceae bacterium]HNC60882.1 arginine--tRNA ligase [Rhodocyclaceae bacterium]
MVVDIKSHLSELLRAALTSVAPEHTAIEITLDRTRQSSHGDFASNLALQLAKPLKRNPRDIAGLLLAELPQSAWIAKAEVAGAGFINFFVAGTAKTVAVTAALRQGPQFGQADVGHGCKVQVEFVSANPTGPLHVGHGRGAAYGSALANVLQATGHVVTREFYVNDAGRQMDILATSVWLRYLELRNEKVNFPADGYRGDYVRDIAALLLEQQGARLSRDTALLPTVQDGEDADAALDALIACAKALLGEEWWTVHRFALDAMLADQRNDLGEFRVHYDVWYSEQSLYANGSVDRAVARLQDAGHLYEQDGALWFRSTAFGDEKDRVVRRDNGAYTYFASDIAYHAEKFARGFDRVIDVWGADHHGYIPRVKGALAALGVDANRLEVALVQFAVLYRGGEKTAMGKRSGEFVTLRDLRREVGDDAARFFYVLRKSDQHLDFDLDLAKSQSNENPVYYIQYAHARVCSVLTQWGGLVAELADTDLAPLSGERELALCARIAAYPEALEAAARDYAPHIVAFYLKDLAADFHSFYNAERILVDDAGIRDARLALVAAVRQTLANGLALLGVSAPETM